MAKQSTVKLSAMGLGLGLGVVWAIFTFIAGITAMFGWSIEFVSIMDTAYIGYAPTFVGAIIGAVWGFIHGFVGGWLTGFFYNKFRK